MTKPLALQTHRHIDADLCGRAVSLSAGASEVHLTATAEMAVDETGLVHGGFVFGLADHAAMLAVNHPNVVLGAAQCRFIKPVAVGDDLIAKANVTSISGRKHRAAVEVVNQRHTVFSGEFDCYILERHVLADVLAATP